MRIEIASCVLLALSVATTPTTARATRIDLAPNQADAGGTTEMCASLSGNGPAVALQMALQWDSRCVSPVLTSGGNPQCTANPSTGKTLVTALLNQSTKIIMLALGAQSTIPNGPIYCCTFNVSQIPPSAVCPFAFSGVSGSDAGGHKLADIVAQGAALSIRQSDNQAAQPAGGVAPAVAGGGITIPGANSAGNPEPLPTTAKNQPAATVGATGYVASRFTPAPEAVGGSGAGEHVGNELPGAEQTPALDSTANTPRSTTTAATPTTRAEATRTAPAATQTSTRATTPTAGTPTPTK